MKIGKKLTLAFAGLGLALVLMGGLALSNAGTALTWTALGISLAACAGLYFFVHGALKSQLGSLVQEIATGADEVASVASQISGASQSLAQGTSQQAASLEETSASTEEINSMARRNSENSRSAADLVKASDQRFTDANKSLEEMVQAMTEISNSSDKISKIIKVIDDIAFQTNILALNAAVEAARAGEAGMGFAVVADEVRNLAQRCAQAARDTAVLIEESITKSSGGQEKVQQVAKAIHAVTQQSTQVKTLVDEVHLGSQEQSRGIDQIGRAMVQMEQATQKAAASAEQSASAAEQLTAQSSALKDVVDRLRSAIGLVSIARPAVRRSPIVPRSQSEIASSLAAMDTAVFHSVRKSPAGVSTAPAPQDFFPMEEEFSDF